MFIVSLFTSAHQLIVLYYDLLQKLCVFKATIPVTDVCALLQIFEEIMFEKVHTVHFKDLSEHLFYHVTCVFIDCSHLES